MEITCAECGCLVDHGVVVKRCEDYPNCCCQHLPVGETKKAEA
jgi:hypothetical protein